MVRDCRGLPETAGHCCKKHLIEELVVHETSFLSTISCEKEIQH